MNGSYLNKLLKIEAEHALYREDGKWYHNLKKFPGVLFDSHGYVLFKSENVYLNHSSLQHKKDLHVMGGISSLNEYRLFNEFERMLIKGFDSSSILKNSNSLEETIRVLREIEIVLRKKALVQQLKKLYDNKCQICGVKLLVGKNKYYSEVHHIIQLGNPYNGSDTLDNMICVCPNHHVQLDLKSIKLDIKTFKLVFHNISETNIDHHNNIYLSKNIS